PLSSANSPHQPPSQTYMPSLANRRQDSSLATCRPCPLAFQSESRRRCPALGLAAFVAGLKDAGVPVLIPGMDDTEPPPADTAVESCDRIAWIIHRRNALTSPVEGPGFCLIQFPQQVPSSPGQYTPVNHHNGTASLPRKRRSPKTN